MATSLAVHQNVEAVISMITCRTLRSVRSTPRRLGIALALAGAVGLTACSSGSAAPSTSQSASSPTTITFATRNITTNLDPAQADDDPSLAYATAVYDTLVRFDSATNSYVPDLAVSWSASSDAKTWTFNLRHGVRFHDGSLLTAKGVEASLDRTIAEGRGESYLLDEVAGMSAPNPSTVVITLKQPNAGFLGNLDQMFIVSYKAIQEHGSVNQGMAWFDSNDAGSGPYELVKWTPNNEIVLKRFPQYWAGWKGKHIDEYIFQVTDPATQTLELRSGTADMADSIPTQEAKQMRSEPQFKVYMNSGGPFYIDYNLASPMMQNVLVRKAITEAIPYSDIVTDVMLGFASNLAGPDPTFMTGYDSALKPAPYDPAASRQLLARAGYSSSKPLALSLMYFNGLNYEQTIATIIQASLRTVGVSVSVQGVPWPTFEAEVGKPSTRPDLGLSEMGVTSPNPTTMLYSAFDPTQEGSWSYWGFNEPSVVSELQQAMAAPSIATQDRLLVAIQSGLVSDYSSAWLMTDPDVLVTGSDVHGVQMDPFDRGMDYYAVWKS
jgi:peptide/nickel transport system substrate-binding protein